MMKWSLIVACLLACSTALGATRPTVKVEPPNLHGSRPLEPETQKAVIRDYVQSWDDFQKAFDLNQAQLLDETFVGTARRKLGQTIQDQRNLKLHTRYEAASHDIQIVFYSPNGLSIQLIDHVAYTEQVFRGKKLLAKKMLHARYLVVLTPSAVRWVVRIFQASPSKQGVQ